MHKFVYWVYLLFTILLPLLFLTSTSELFEFPKFLLLLTASGIILISYLFDGFKNKNWSLNYKNPLGYSIIGILATQTIATIFSIHPYTSFWGYYSRFHQGLLTTVCYSILYFGASKYLDMKSIQKILKTMVKVSLLVAFLAILEHFNFSFTCPAIYASQLPEGKHLEMSRKIFSDSCWKESTNPLYRSFSTLGQPNWLAAYLIPNIFLIFYYYFIDSRKKTSSILFSYAVTYLLLFSALLFTKSRSGYLAFGLSTFVYLFLFVRQNSFTKIKSVLTKLILITGIAIALYLLPSFWQKASVNVVSTPASNDSPALTVESTSSAEIRQIVWSGALKLFTERPIFGFGPETFAYTYYQVRPLSHNYTTEWDFLYNKAHNEYLNFAACSGLIGLLAYLYYHYSVLKTTYQKVETSKKVNKEFEYYKKSFYPVVGAALVSFTVTNFFGFSIIPVYTFMILLSAFTQVKDQEFDHHVPTSLPSIVFLTAIIAVYIVFMPIRLYFADLYYTIGKSLGTSQKFDKAVDFLKTATSLRPGEDLYTTTLGDLYASQGETDLALHELTKSKAENNLHQNYLKSRAKSYISLAAKNTIYYQNAIEELELAFKLAPTDPKLAYNLGLVYSRVGKPEESINSMKKALVLKKDYYDPYYALTLLYENTKQEKYIPDLLVSAKANLTNIPAPLQTKIEKYLGK